MEGAMRFAIAEDRALASLLSLEANHDTAAWLDRAIGILFEHIYQIGKSLSRGEWAVVARKQKLYES